MLLQRNVQLNYADILTRSLYVRYWHLVDILCVLIDVGFRG